MYIYIYLYIIVYSIILYILILYIIYFSSSPAESQQYVIYLYYTVLYDYNDEDGGHARWQVDAVTALNHDCIQLALVYHDILYYIIL